MLRRLVAVVLALFLPPAGVMLSRGPGGAFLVVLALFIAGQGVFWFLAAGPGLALWLASVILALPLAFRLSRSV